VTVEPKPELRPRALANGVRVIDCGLQPYARMHPLMQGLVAQRLVGQGRDTLLLVEHPKVITLGRGAKRSNLLMSEEQLHDAGFSLVETARGGDVTAHGPGQLVAYPIFDLAPDRADVRRYVRDLGEVMCGVCQAFGIQAVFSPEYIGAWVDDAAPREVRPWSEQSKKIGAIGVKLSRWVTMHGFALNITTDASVFAPIIPCGLVGRSVCSLKDFGAVCTMQQAKDEALLQFARVFGASFDPAEPESVLPALEAELLTFANA
jgi:lipoyl(octanoyl) transferase